MYDIIIVIFGRGGSGDDSGCGGQIIIGIIALVFAFLTISFLCNLPFATVNLFFNTNYCVFVPIFERQQSPCWLAVADWKAPLIGAGLTGYKVDTSGYSRSQSPKVEGDSSVVISDQSPYESLTVYTQDGSRAMIRERPSRDSKVIARVYPGTKLSGVKQVDGEEIAKGNKMWWKVVYNNKEGYIYSKLVR